MNTFQHVRIVGALAFVSALGACADAGQDDALEAVPELSALALSVSDDPSSEASAEAADEIDPAAEHAVRALDELQAKLDADATPGLLHAREAVKHINQALRRFMQPIAAMVRDSDPTTSAGKVRTWGPVTRGATELRFVVRHGIGRHYGWVLQARAANSADDFETVAAGRITVGFEARRGVGSIGVDLDALGHVDPTVVARGKLLASFKHGPRGNVFGYALHDFTPNPAEKEPVDALLQYVRLLDGRNRLRLAYRGNLPESSTAAEELVLARVRHKRGDGGRADMLVTAGDVPDGKIWIVSECWTSNLESTFRIVRECPGDGLGGDRCEVVRSHGDATACGKNVREAELPPANGMTPMSDAESPEGDVTPPDAMPDGSA